MFDTKKTSVTGPAANAIDLVIDFATLGEYGLEPVPAAAARPCEGRHREASRRSSGAWATAISHFATAST